MWFVISCLSCLLREGLNARIKYQKLNIIICLRFYIPLFILSSGLIEKQILQHLEVHQEYSTFSSVFQEMWRNTVSRVGYVNFLIFFFADESKINSMLSETDRNREMCNQIVRRVFTDPVQTNSDQLLRPFGRLVSTTGEFD